MKDNLENFIQRNRDAFDQSQPDLKVWAGIEKSLGTTKTRRISFWRPFAAAASVLLLIGIGTLIGWQLHHGQSQSAMAEFSPELEEMKEYYETRVAEKTALLTHYQADPTVVDDLSQLETFLQELQSELAEAPRGSEEQIINAMIENYQDRLEILERVLSRIKSTNQESQKLNKDEEINL